MRYALIPSLIVLALGCGGLAKSLDDDTRESLTAQTRTVLSYWDHDGDGKLNDAEVTAMTEAGFPLWDNGPPRWMSPEELDKTRHELLGYYRSQDANGDGYLTLD